MADKIDEKTAPLLRKIGKTLRRLREEQGFTQDTLAKQIAMEPTNLAKVERGEKNVTIDTLRRFAEGLELGLEVRFPKRPTR